MRVSHKPFLSARVSFLWLFLAPSSIFQLPSENVGIRTVLHVPAWGPAALTLSNQQDHFQCQSLRGGRGGGRRNPWQRAELHRGPSALGFTLFSQLQKPASARADLFPQAVSWESKEILSCALQDSWAALGFGWFGVCLCIVQICTRKA